MSRLRCVTNTQPYRAASLQYMHVHTDTYAHMSTPVSRFLWILNFSQLLGCTSALYFYVSYLLASIAQWTAYRATFSRGRWLFYYSVDGRIYDWFCDAAGMACHAGWVSYNLIIHRLLCVASFSPSLSWNPTQLRPSELTLLTSNKWLLRRCVCIGSISLKSSFVSTIPLTLSSLCQMRVAT